MIIPQQITFKQGIYSVFVIAKLIMKFTNKMKNILESKKIENLKEYQLRIINDFADFRKTETS